MLCDPLPREGHDLDCDSLYFEPCNCVSGILAAVSSAFAAQLAALTTQQEPV